MTLTTLTDVADPVPARAIVRVQAADLTSSVISVFVDAAAAKRAVTSWVIGEVANMLRADGPVLIVEPTRAFWRVPVVLTSRAGVIGEVGTIEVDAQTGAFETTVERAHQLVERAQQLVSDRNTTGIYDAPGST